METGIYDGISNADYHKKDGHYSSSLIKKMAVPAKARHYMLEDQEHKDCFRIGTAIHTYVLERDKFEDEFLTGISAGRRSKADKMEWAAWFVEHGAANGYEIIDMPAAKWNGEFMASSGKNMVTPEEIEQIKSMAESVMFNKTAESLLSKGKAEQSVYWTDKETGMNLKVRPDYLDDDFISDLKSIQSVDDKSIIRSFANCGYGISQAMYQAGVAAVTGKWRPFLFVYIEKEPPYLCRVIGTDDDTQAAFWELYQAYKAKLAMCLETDEWPGIDDDLSMALPDWAVGG